ncbi:transglycosylase SLT domain-containing protein [Labedaea rhizosphaerae]|uniref:Type VII secretion system (Wss) protein ESAT-6 n=1 Tax=Labedaea rhizosphaerae TaxID=598644 RepID=A0A4V3D0F2_LABRH|nr:transglycosylase SLT domain-containing protein [Labedaea rhizosphaerae]TDQ05375.1 type VII secretion system (Wss) protein ESAT-6 [Labedaea rhizosphaerae]
MTNQESVRALPGSAAPALANIADKVYKADLGGIEGLKAKLTGAADNFTNNVETKLNPAVQGLDDAWQGQSADQFVAYMGKFKTAGTQVHQALTDAAGDVEAAHGALDEARTNLEGTFGRLLQDATEQKPPAEQVEEGGEDWAAVCDRIAGQYAAEVTQHINNANTALGNIATTLKGRAGEIAAGFSSIPAANDQVFTPAPGHKVEWVPTPEDEGKTAPSGTGDGSDPGNGNGSNAGGSNSGGSDNGGGGTSAGPGGGGNNGGGGGMGSSGPPPTEMPPGNVDEWIKEAIKVLQAHGVNVSEADIPTIWAIIQHESGGNPNAINNWDSNAAAGHPSKGLMQCIDSTFNAYKMPGYDNIYGPVDNICAGVNYAISRYGSLSNVPGIASMASGGGYKGY